jgi:hypothetical protein
MQRSIVISTLVLAGLTAAPALVLAQADPASIDEQNSAMTETAPMTQQDDAFDWGWIGLLGLAGLMGLKRRERETRDTVRTRQPGQPV